jgi:FG-GAP repeat
MERCALYGDVMQSNKYFCRIFILLLASVGGSPLLAQEIPFRGEPSVAQQIHSPSGTAGEQFGSHLSLSGDRVAIGAYSATSNGITNSGAVYTYIRKAGLWTFEAQPMPLDPTSGSYLGTVALQGTRLLAGAAGHANGIGAAYIFERASNGTWVQQAKLVPDNPTTDCVLPNGCHLFGIAVALDGDTAVVGASRENERMGAAYVFVRDGQGVWARQQRLTTSDPSTYPHFGSAVALQGDTLVVGAEFQDVEGTIYRGAAHVFVRSAGNWTQSARLVANDGEGDDNFGSTLALDGNTLLVGSRLANLGSQNNRGAAYVFVRNAANVWNLQARLNASDGVGSGAPDDRWGDQFSFAMGLRGNEAWISRYPGNLTTALPERNGSVYRFARQSGLWTETHRFTAASGSPGDGFGSAVAFDNNSLLVGARGEGTAPGEPTLRGVVFAYTQNFNDGIFDDDFDG